MRTALFHLVAVVASVMAATSGSSFPTAAATRPASDYLWPYPKTIVDHNTVVNLPAGGFQVKAFNDNDYFFEDLEAAIAALQTSFSSKVSLTSSSAQKYPVTIAIDRAIKGPAQLVDVNESYSLNVTASGATIHAPNQVGARYALQTLSQLVTAQGTLAVADIADQPRFAYRGFMLDTARNYFYVEDIKRVLDGLAATKINVFHWHIYDTQSFPIKWDSHLELLKAAYKDAQGKPKIYTEQNVRDIVQYAYQRNIRVIPEFEMPGHNGVFGHVDPSLVSAWNHSPWDNYNGYPANATNLTPDNQYVGWGRQYCAEPPCGQLDVRKPKAIALLDQLISEVGAWFADPYLHVGHDEVNARAYGLVPDSWDSVPNEAVYGLMREFEPKLVNMLAKYGKKYAAWDEVITNYGIEQIVPKDALITLWEDPSAVAAATALGISKIVVGPWTDLYFDCSPSQIWCQNYGDEFLPATTYSDPNYIFFPGKWHTWQTMYTYDPFTGVADSDKGAIYGGFGALWTETVKRHNLDKYVFPRVAAVGERYWSFDAAPAFNPLDAASVAATSARLERFRASLINEHAINSATLDYGGNEEGTVYRMEACDGPQRPEYYTTSSGGEAGMPVVDINGNAPNATGNFYYGFGDFCKIASTYKTNSFVPVVPSKVAYPY